MATSAIDVPRVAREDRTPAWVVVAGQELRDLWVSGRGLPLAVAFSVLVSVIAYLVATNRALNFLEQREAINLTLQVAIAVGALLTLLAGADAISGERERGTLESLLLTPAARLALVVGKLVAALSLWFVAFAITIPYVWFLGRGIGLVGDALVTGFVVGTTLSLFLVSLGLIVSVFAASNRVSLSLCLFILLALFAPTQLPSSAQKGWAGELLLRVNPITAGEHYVGKIVTNGHPWRDDVSWLISPFVAAVVFTGAAVLLGARFLRLRGGRST
jgi:ABC-2 type transport system permease protein